MGWRDSYFTCSPFDTLMWFCDEQGRKGNYQVGAYSISKSRTKAQCRGCADKSSGEGTIKNVDVRAPELYLL